MKSWWTGAPVVKTLFWLPTFQINCLYAWIFFVFAKMIIMQNSAWIFLSHKTWASMQPKWPSTGNPLGFAYAQ
jgi:hypothetical protein